MKKVDVKNTLKRKDIYIAKFLHLMVFMSILPSSNAPHGLAPEYEKIYKFMLLY